MDKIKALMTLGDTMAGYKTHLMTLLAVLTTMVTWLTVVVIPFASGDVSIIALVTESWPYLTAIFGAFGASAVKAGLDRK